jgi:phosphatidylinositol alpha 1,6-mannosyltransferase
MRVAHVSDVCLPNIGGIEILVDDLARRQAAAGHRVTILTSSPGAASNSGSDVEVVRPRSRLDMPRHLSDVRRRIDAGEFDVVHGHLSVLSAFTSVVGGHAARTGAPLTLTVHSMWNGRRAVVAGMGAVVGWRRWPVRWTAVSSAAACDVRRVVGSDVDVAVVPNAVETGWWRDAVELSPPAPGRPITFVSVMRMVERKRPMALVRALHRARKRVPQNIAMRAVLVGDGPLAAIVSDELRRRRMSTWVSMAGQVDRSAVRDIYADADVYVAPAERESFGIAALEARTAGLAIVAMRQGGVGDFVRHGVEGLLCEDDGALADALVAAATQPTLVEAIAEHNRTSLPAITWDETMASYLSCYRQARANAEARAAGGPSDRTLVGMA